MLARSLDHYRIEELIGLPVELVSVGPGRNEPILRGELFTR